MLGDNVGGGGDIASRDGRSAGCIVTLVDGGRDGKSADGELVPGNLCESDSSCSVGSLSASTLPSGAAAISSIVGGDVG
jgi:hypothetical protein